MTSRIALITLMTAALSATGLMAKQDVNAGNRRAGFVARVSTALNLTDQQKQQAQGIFRSERQQASTVRQELRQERKAVESAIHSGKPIPEIQQLAKNEAPALGELAGIRAIAFAKFYGVLTPAQQQKLASMHHEWRQNHAARTEAGKPEPSR